MHCLDLTPFRVNGYGIGKDLCRQRALGLFGQRGKTGCVVHGDVSQDLAIRVMPAFSRPFMKRL